MPMRRLTAILLLGLCVALPARAQQSGIYDVTGVNLDGTPYTGFAQIRQSGLASFNIIWRIGNDVIEGVGFASGRTISVAYGLAQRPGIGIYQLNPDGSMEGEWTIIGAPAIGRERQTLRGAPAAAAPAATPAPEAAPAPAPAADSPPAAAPAAAAPAAETPAAPPR